jgi:DNA (cytosine-5)-methyltransferase 1
METGGEVRVLDLFCGMGGLALGFALNGFRVIGYDIHPRVPEIFQINRIGLAVTADLTDPASIRLEHRDVQVVTGGPPCRPWSALNLQRRGSRHPDHPLLGAFFRAIREILPEAFLMENVPRAGRFRSPSTGSMHRPSRFWICSNRPRPGGSGS